MPVEARLWLSKCQDLVGWLSAWITSVLLPQKAALNFILCLTDDQLCFGLNEPLTLTCKDSRKALLTMGPSVVQPTNEAHVQLAWDRWSKFLSNQCWGWSDEEGSPDFPMGLPSYWCMVPFDMFDQVVLCSCIHFAMEIHAKEEKKNT